MNIATVSLLFRYKAMNFKKIISLSNKFSSGYIERREVKAHVGVDGSKSAKVSCYNVSLLFSPNTPIFEDIFSRQVFIDIYKDRIEIINTNKNEKFTFFVKDNFLTTRRGTRIATLGQENKFLITSHMYSETDINLYKSLRQLRSSSERVPKLINNHLRNIMLELSKKYSFFSQKNILQSMSYLLENKCLFHYFSKKRSQEEILETMKKFYSYSSETFQDYLTFRLSMAQTRISVLSIFNMDENKIKQNVFPDLVDSFGFDLYETVFGKSFSEVLSSLDLASVDNNKMINYMKKNLILAEPNLKNDNQALYLKIGDLLGIKSFSFFLSKPRGRDSIKVALKNYINSSDKQKFQRYLSFRIVNKKNELLKALSGSEPQINAQLAELLPDIIEEYSNKVFHDIFEVKSSVKLSELLQSILDAPHEASLKEQAQWAKLSEKVDRNLIDKSRAHRNARAFFVKNVLSELKEILEEKGKELSAETEQIIRKSLRFPNDINSETNKYRMFLQNGIWSQKEYDAVFAIGMSTKNQVKEIASDFQIYKFYTHIETQRKIMMLNGVAPQSISRVISCGFSYHDILKLSKTSEWDLKSLLNMKWFSKGEKRKETVFKGKTKKNVLSIKHLDKYNVDYIVVGYRSLQFKFSLKHWLVDSIKNRTVTFDANPEVVTIYDSASRKEWKFVVDTDNYLLDIKGNIIAEDIHFNHVNKKVNLMLTNYIREDNYSSIRPTETIQIEPFLVNEQKSSSPEEDIFSIIDTIFLNAEKRSIEIATMREQASLKIPDELFGSSYFDLAKELKGEYLDEQSLFEACAKQLGHKSLVLYLSRKRTNAEILLVKLMFFSPKSNQYWAELFATLFDQKDISGKSMALNKISSSNEAFYDFCKLNGSTLYQFPKSLIFDTFSKEEDEKLIAIIYRIHHMVRGIKADYKSLGSKILYNTPSLNDIDNFIEYYAVDSLKSSFFSLKN